MVEAGEITAEQARNSHNLALLLVGFLATEAGRADVRDMFENNDGEHFIDGLRSSPKFAGRFAHYLGSVYAAA